MIFREDGRYYDDAIFIHIQNREKELIGTMKLILEHKGVSNSDIAKFTDIYKLIFLHHNTMLSEKVNDFFSEQDRIKFSNYLFAYVKQYYPNIDLLKKVNNPDELSKILSKYLNLLQNDVWRELWENNNLEYIKINLGLIEEAFELFGFVTDLMIRFYGYSIIGISGQKTIVTSSNNCEKKFIDYLLEGYSLFKLQRVYLINDGKSFDNMHYEFLPCLPTKDIGFPIEEYIETSNDNNMNTRKMVKVLNYKI